MKNSKTIIETFEILCAEYIILHTPLRKFCDVTGPTLPFLFRHFCFIFTSGKITKSRGARSGLYGSWSSTINPNFTRNSE